MPVFHDRETQDNIATEEVSRATEVLVARCDEIVTAYEDRPEELSEIFSRKGVHLSIDICMGFAAAVARTEMSEDLRQSAVAIQRLREHAMPANHALAELTAANPHIISAAIQCEELIFDLISEGNPIILILARLATRYSIITRLCLRAALSEIRHHILADTGDKPIKVEIVKGDARPNRRGRSYGEKDEALHEIRAQVVAEMRRRKKATNLSWPEIVTALRGNSAYVARLKGKTDETWIRYAKSGFRD